MGGGALALAGAGAAYFGSRQMGTMEECNDSVSATSAALSQAPEMSDFIRFATLAANSYNTEPRLVATDIGRGPRPSPISLRVWAAPRRT
jgi:hypothetical protein